MNSTLEQMAQLRAEAQCLLQKVADARENSAFFSHERVHLNIACQRLESAVWALGQTETGDILGPAFGRQEAVHA